MNLIDITKAPLAADDEQDVMISIRARVVNESQAKTLTRYSEEALLLFEVLSRTLPSGTFNRLLDLMNETNRQE